MPERVLLLTFLLLSLLGTADAASETELGLAGFDLVIGDSGLAGDSWDSSPTRVYAEVAGAASGYYFNSIASAFFVLREKHGDPIRMEQLLVADYDADGSDRMLDARHAWYFWDSERQAKGGLPLILAFSTRAAARQMARVRNGVVLEFPDLTVRLRRWCSAERSRVAWRGNFDWSADRWEREWNRRWDGWIEHREYGWCDERSLRHEPHFFPPSGERNRHHGRWQAEDQQAAERRQRERQDRERREREERERQERERQEREERPRDNPRPGQGINKGTHDAQFGANPDTQEQRRREEERQRDEARRKDEERRQQQERERQKEQKPPQQEAKPESKDDGAQPAPPPSKGTNDPRKDG